tara:strand:- start:360 stop:899 length:540 start_codon:yes stop_codon:yes gene_type:complete
MARRKFKKKSLLKRVKRKKRSKKGSKRKRTKRKRTKRNRTKRNGTKKRRKRNKGQRGGYGGCNNPFQGKVSVPGRSGNYYPFEPRGGRLPLSKLTRQSGGGLWRNLGLTFPKDLYNDSSTFLNNVKNSYTGDRHVSTSDVLQQPIGQQSHAQFKPVDYPTIFKNADLTTANMITPPTLQ